MVDSKKTEFYLKQNNSLKNLDEIELNVILKKHDLMTTSAEHYDQLLWVTSTIFFAGTMVLIAGIIDGIGRINHQIITLMSMLGIFTSLSAIYFRQSFKQLKSIKQKKVNFIENGIIKLVDNREEKVLKTFDENSYCFRQGWLYNTMWIILIVFFILVLLLLF